MPPWKNGVCMVMIARGLCLKRHIVSVQDHQLHLHVYLFCSLGWGVMSMYSTLESINICMHKLILFSKQHMFAVLISPHT